MQPQGSSRQQNPEIASSNLTSSKKTSNRASTPSRSTNPRTRNPAGTPRPNADVITLSPRTLLATNRFVCEVCKKGFQRDQNLQLHLRGHNLPWKLKPKNPKEAHRRVYVCPVPTCVHHSPSRALGDLTGIKKHYSRKHGVKNLKCDKCNKRYAVESDWKAHCKTCGTREYRCNCGTLFSRKDTYTTHRANCGVVLAADREAIQMPPPARGAGRNVDSGSDSLRLSGAATSMLGFADQGQSSSAAAEASLFDHMIPSYPGSSMFPASQASDFSSSFLLGGGAPATNHPDLLFEHGSYHSEGVQDPLPHGKSPMHALMHVPEQHQYQTSYSNNYLGLFSGNSGGESGSQGTLPHGKEPFHGHDMMMQLPEQPHHQQPSTSNAYLEFLSGNSGGTSSSQGPLLHGKEPFQSHDLMMQLPEQQHYDHPGSSNSNVNIPNLGFFSGNNSGSWSGASSQDARLVIQDQFNGGAGGSNTEHVNVMASSIGSHFGGGFSSLQYSPSASAGLSATAILMKAAQMDSTSSTTRNGPSALLRAAGFTGTVGGQGTTGRAAEEGVMSHEAHFDDLVMKSPPLMGGATGNLSTRDFLGIGGDEEAMTPAAGLHMGALDPAQMKWFM